MEIKVSVKVNDEVVVSVSHDEEVVVRVFDYLPAIDTINQKITAVEETVNRLVSTAVNEQATTEEATYRLSPDGDDELGDGSGDKPWRSIRKALTSIPSILLHPTTILLMAGSQPNAVYNILDEDLELLNKWVLKNKLSIMGEVRLVSSNYSTEGSPTHTNNPFRRNIVSGALDINQFTGCAARCISGSSEHFAPIGQHGAQYITVNSFADGYTLNGGIYDYAVTINFEKNKLPSNLIGLNVLSFNRLKLQFNGAMHVDLRTKHKVEFAECVFLPYGTGNKMILMDGVLVFSRCLFLSNNVASPCIRVYDTNNVEISSCQIAHINPGASRESAIRMRNASLVLQMVLIQGFAYGLREESSVNVTQYYGHYPLVFENIGALFSLRGSNFTFSRGNWYGESKMYIENVNYLFSLEGATHNINVDLRNYIQNGKSAVIQPFVTATSRVWQGGANLTSSSLSGIPARLVDHLKNWVLIHDQAFPEVDACKVSIANCGSGVVTLGDITKNKFIQLNYFADRGGLRQLGTITVTNLNDTFIDVTSRLDSCGLEFTKQIVGNSIELKITDTLANGIASSFSASVERVMV